MWWVLGAWVALADESTVEVPFAPPAELPLFVKAEVASVRGTVKGSDCGAAVSAALAEAATRGKVVRIVRSKEDLTSVTQTVCKQRRAGDDVSASVVDLSVIVLEPGSPASVYPTVSAERAVRVATMIDAVDGTTGAVVIDDIEGEAWVRLGVETLTEPLDSSVLDAEARGAVVWDRYVAAWASRWLPVLSSVPEVNGAVLEVVVPYGDPAVKKSRGTELFRFAVPTAAATAWLKGQLGEDTFLAASRVERASDPRKRIFVPVTLVIGETGRPLAVQRLEERATIEIDEEDLEGVEDE